MRSIHFMISVDHHATKQTSLFKEKAFEIGVFTPLIHYIIKNMGGSFFRLKKRKSEKNRDICSRLFKTPALPIYFSDISLRISIFLVLVCLLERSTATLHLTYLANERQLKTPTKRLN